MSQSVKHSAFEAIMNVASGFLISMAVWNFIAAPLMKNVFQGDIASFKNNIIITCIFTISSLIRSFIWRRVFNKVQVRSNYESI